MVKNIKKYSINKMISSTTQRPTIISERHNSLSKPSTLNVIPKQKRRLSREEIINEMENEQDAIVVKLLKEIDQLKMENLYLKEQLNQKNQCLRRNSIDCGARLNKNSNNITDNECAITTDEEDSSSHIDVPHFILTGNSQYRVPRTPRASFNSISSKSGSFNHYSTMGAPPIQVSNKSRASNR
ncbi:Rts3p NDAI_0H00450 [Naumovozyma dairenensis CBS 421]|uniref:Uncharacterized protein n=1 Tax=Naumovozyma dairenensis (strain ATCC 10597 / BCRC 20456 / CBS 421 / NBRC 0211 / NRRL Y-12639) TaxID=1071378 RepID=G0WEK8_NAUDC|nr:hypothetical protein NDAI_0H00450 [Naumovozyma dairenensis CBS 421]CCD26219.1 hypothetical protein NDAI_0H00450 [Naumovozyma dairenensis CBS 421]